MVLQGVSWFNSYCVFCTNCKPITLLKKHSHNFYNGIVYVQQTLQKKKVKNKNCIMHTQQVQIKTIKKFV